MYEQNYMYLRPAYTCRPVRMRVCGVAGGALAVRGACMVWMVSSIHEMGLVGAVGEWNVKAKVEEGMEL